MEPYSSCWSSALKVQQMLLVTYGCSTTSEAEPGPGCTASFTKGDVTVYAIGETVADAICRAGLVYHRIMTGLWGVDGYDEGRP